MKNKFFKSIWFPICLFILLEIIIIAIIGIYLDVIYSNCNDCGTLSFLDKVSNGWYFALRGIPITFVISGIVYLLIRRKKK